MTIEDAKLTSAELYEMNIRLRDEGLLANEESDYRNGIRITFNDGTQQVKLGISVVGFQKKIIQHIIKNQQLYSDDPFNDHTVKMIVQKNAFANLIQIGSGKNTELRNDSATLSDKGETLSQLALSIINTVPTRLEGENSDQIINIQDGCIREMGKGDYPDPKTDPKLAKGVLISYGLERGEIPGVNLDDLRTNICKDIHKHPFTYTPELVKVNCLQRIAEKQSLTNDELQILRSCLGSPPLDSNKIETVLRTCLDSDSQFQALSELIDHLGEIVVGHKNQLTLLDHKQYQIVATRKGIQFKDKLNNTDSILVRADPKVSKDTFHRMVMDINGFDKKQYFEYAKKILTSKFGQLYSDRAVNDDVFIDTQLSTMIEKGEEKITQEYRQNLLNKKGSNITNIEIKKNNIDTQSFIEVSFDDGEFAHFSKRKATKGEYRGDALYTDLTNLMGKDQSLREMILKNKGTKKDAMAIYTLGALRSETVSDILGCENGGPFNNQLKEFLAGFKIDGIHQDTIRDYFEGIWEATEISNPPGN